MLVFLGKSMALAVVFIALIAFLVGLAVLMYLGLLPWLKVTKRDKEYVTLLVAGTGIVLFWRGVWHLADITPVVENPFVSLFLGLLILTLTGFVWREF